MKVTAATRADSIHPPEGAVTRDQRGCLRVSDGAGRYFDAPETEPVRVVKKSNTSGGPADGPGGEVTR